MKYALLRYIKHALLRYIKHALQSYIKHALLCYYYYYYFGVRCAKPGVSEDTLSVQRPQPYTTDPWKEEKYKLVGDKKEEADHANRHD